LNSLDKKLFSTIDIIICIAFTPSLNPASSKAISEKTGLGARVVEQILQILVKADILKAIRGANGGYLLAKERRKINLYEIHLAIEKLNKSKKDFNLSEISKDVVLDLKKKLWNDTKEILQNTTIEDLYKKAEKNNNSNKSSNKTPNKKKTDFVI